MKIETKLLEGQALDWAVATALGLQLHKDALLGGVNMRGWWISGLSDDPNTWTSLRNFQPSSNWVIGGPIIEREGILLRPIRKPGHSFDGLWLAKRDNGNTGETVRWHEFQFGKNGQRRWWKGEAPLIAAMRCCVASRLGDEIDVPEELL